MVKKITNEQLEELRYATDFREYLDLLKEYTGIEAVPYTAYSFYDNVGNYIGDSTNSDTMDLLEAAYIEVEG